MNSIENRDSRTQNILRRQRRRRQVNRRGPPAKEGNYKPRRRGKLESISRTERTSMIASRIGDPLTYRGRHKTWRNSAHRRKYHAMTKNREGQGITSTEDDMRTWRYNCQKSMPSSPVEGAEGPKAETDRQKLPYNNGVFPLMRTGTISMSGFGLY